MVDLPRFRRRQQQHPPRFYDKPSRERHFVSIIGSVLSMIMLVVALALREWAKAGDSKCDFTFGLTKVYITLKNSQETLDENRVSTRNAAGKKHRLEMNSYYTEEQQILISCILSVTVLTLLSSIVAIVISAGYPREKMEFLRHYSVFNIVSLLCIVLVAGLWLAVTQSLPSGEAEKEENCNKDTPVSFGYCFYFLLVGGLFSLGGASINLLCARSAADRRRSLRNRFRERQNREASRRPEGGDRDLTSAPQGVVPPPYSFLESELSDTGGETTETSMSEPEPTDLDEPISPPPPYTP